MNRRPRSYPIRQIVIHVNVGPETPKTSAESLAGWLAMQSQGYHQVHDDDSSLTLARDDEEVNGARGGDCNHVAIHHCIIGRADQTAAQWHDPFSTAAMRRCAAAVAEDCRAHNINALHIVNSAIRDKARTGICGHGDVTRAWAVFGGHTDPGTNFPWTEFIALVEAQLTVVKPPVYAPPPWLSEWNLDMPLPTDVTDVLVTDFGSYKLKADGSVESLPNSEFWGSYFSIPPAGRLGARHFTSISRRPGGAKGYVLWGNDGSYYTFGPDITY